jgi:Flp pilus assembly protein TadG
MKAPACRGATMALYAAFLALVGIPLMALTVDVTRVYLANVRLRNATAAGCEAYVRSLDTKKFIEKGETDFSSDAAGNAYEVFGQSAPQGSTLEVVPTVKNGRAVALCTGKNSLRPIVFLLPSYKLSSKAAAKADFATTRNW